MAAQSPEVDAFMRSLDHPAKREIETFRQTILGADKSIAEGIKWKAPSFRTTEYFATVHLRTKEGFGVILHLGAKVRAGAKVAIDDPAGMLQWLAKDRALVTFRDAKDLAAKRAAFRRVVQQWIRHV
jgi:hypothetical protein